MSFSILDIQSMGDCYLVRYIFELHLNTFNYYIIIIQKLFVSLFILDVELDGQSFYSMKFGLLNNANITFC